MGKKLTIFGASIRKVIHMAPDNDCATRRERAMAFLRGKVLRRRESNVSMSGVISTSQTRYALFLYEDDTYNYEITEFRSVSSGGYGSYSIPSEESRTISGIWEIQILDDKPFLVLWKDGALLMRWHNLIGDEGIHLLDGEEWNRYLIRR